MLTGPKKQEEWPNGQSNLVEIPFEDNEKKEKPKEVPDSNSKWRLYTDGASNTDGSGVGLMLIDPEGKEYTYALRFKFEITNNEAEYEALLVGLQIAQEMEIVKVAIFLDSQLLVNQIKGTFVAKQTSIKDYLQKVKTALRGFEETRRTKQADINDLRISHKGSVSRSFDQKVNIGKRSFEDSVFNSDESGVTYTEVSSLFEGLSDIGSPRADDHEYLELLGMPEDLYVEAALRPHPHPISVLA
ncbi:reverse transcriptase domain-containing protein [Tanacetum coccineum]|uniref:Reverse transcriptase domain-containing protein n=1 Tax=Tanacetum coccineum TaxID=301880 RepID=A0ABQ5GXV0_9ASTR